MADNTKKPAETKPTTSMVSTTAATRTKPATTKPAARARTAPAAAPATRRRAPATARTAAATAKKTATRPSVARKSPPVKKAAHEPAPFSGKDNKARKPAKAKKAKLVRDSFTMPELEYALIAALKKRCLDAGVSAKKSEILRAAVANLAKLSDASVVAAVRRLEVIKTGRPAKGSK
jgi:hypothetical protein